MSNPGMEYNVGLQNGAVIGYSLALARLENQVKNCIDEIERKFEGRSMEIETWAELESYGKVLELIETARQQEKEGEEWENSLSTNFPKLRG